MVIGVFLLTALVIIVSVLLHEQSLSAYEQELSEQKMTNLPQDIKDLRAREERLLTTAEVLDSANSICRIPIERAMELMVRDYEEAGE